jgi:hypothetical protein
MLVGVPKSGLGIVPVNPLKGSFETDPVYG